MILIRMINVPGRITFWKKHSRVLADLHRGPTCYIASGDIQETWKEDPNRGRDRRGVSEIRHVEGLSVDRTIDCISKLLAEVRRVDVRGIQDRFVEILVGPRVIVVVSEDVGGRGRQEPTCLDLLRVGTKLPTTSDSAEGARAHGKRPSRMEDLNGISPSMRSVRTFSSSSDSHHIIGPRASGH